MDEIKRASIYLRILWLNDNVKLRPKKLDIKLEGENIENIVFSISEENKNIGNKAPWEANEWANGITYSYQKEQQEVDENEERVISTIPYIVPSIVDDIFLQNYRKNIIKNAETEDYSYYTVKMTYIPTKRKMMSAIRTTPNLIFNSTIIENVNFNKIEVDKVIFNGVTVFEKKKMQGFADMILANSTVNEGTPDFSLTATTDEGIFKTEDNDGTSYYFRGAVTNNHVKFAGFWWRIIRINGDGTIRLIYDDIENHENEESVVDNTSLISASYNSKYNRSEYVGWTYTEGLQRPLDKNQATNSDAKAILENWFNDHLASYEDKIAVSNYNNKRNTQNSWTSTPTITLDYETCDEIIANKTPFLICNNLKDIYKLKIGLITAEDIALSGGVWTSNNINYYLYSGYKYWTMSPMRLLANGRSNWGVVFMVNENGGIGAASISSENWTTGQKVYFKPVTNIKPDVEVTGAGTAEDPYVIGGAE